MHVANENEELRGERVALEQELEPLRERVAELETLAHGMQRTMTQLMATKRYRLAASMAAPLDWARERRRS